MKITKTKLRKLIQETSKQKTPEQKLLGLVRNGHIYQADNLAIGAEIDLFPIIAKDYQAINALLGGLIDDTDLRNYMYMVADNSLFGQGFFNAMMYVLPQFSSLTFGMSIKDIEDLINNDPEQFAIYLDSEMSLHMSYSSVIVDGGTMINEVKDWLVAIGFLKLERLYNIASKTNKEFSIVDAMMNLRTQ
jgi:hypothetical protein